MPSRLPWLSPGEALMRQLHASFHSITQAEWRSRQWLNRQHHMCHCSTAQHLACASRQQLTLHLLTRTPLLSKALPVSGNLNQHPSSQFNYPLKLMFGDITGCNNIYRCLDVFILNNDTHYFSFTVCLRLSDKHTEHIRCCFGQNL